MIIVIYIVMGLAVLFFLLIMAGEMQRKLRTVENENDWKDRQRGMNFEGLEKSKLIDGGIEYSISLFGSGKKAWYLNGKLVYNDKHDNTDNFNLGDKIKLDIVKYRLSK